MTKGDCTMICPNCHRELSAGSRFCNFCGTAIRQEVRCGQCGAVLAPGSRFCNVCGAAVGGAREGGLSEDAMRTLCDMKKLLDAGIITQEEFDENRDRLMGRKEAALAAAEAQEREKRQQEQEALLQEQLGALDGQEDELRAQLEQVRAARQEVQESGDALRAEIDELRGRTAALLAENGITQEKAGASAPEGVHKKRTAGGLPKWLIPAGAAVAAAVVIAIVAVAVFGKSEAVKALETQIGSIGEVSLGDIDRIEKAEAMRDALKPSELKKVENLQALEDARREYEELYARNVKKEIGLLEERIAAIGTVTLESGDAVRIARTRYDNASAEVRSGISNYDVLTAAEETLGGLQVSAVEEAIAAIGTVTLKSGDVIDEAQSAYRELPSELRGRVSNAQALEDAKERLKELENAEAEREKNEALASLRKEEDKVTKTTWYYPSVFPKYTDTRCFVLPYIGERSSGAWLRLRMNYTSRRSWVFWTKITFSIDGDNTTYSYKYSDITRDNDTEVWEYHDIPVNDKELELLNRIVESEETIVRFQGDDHHSDFTISASDKTAIRQLLLAYKYL